MTSTETTADASTFPAHLKVNCSSPVDAFRWLMLELGTRGLSGVFLRKGVPVFVPVIGEEGYIAPVVDESLPGHKRDHNGPATIRALNASRLVARLALNYYVYKKIKQGKGDTAKYVDVESFFPMEAAQHAIETVDAAHNLRQLRGVTHTPMVRADGSILDTPGYDEASGFLYLPDVDVLPVPAQPDANYVTWAVQLLRGMIDQFKWDGPHDEANFLGALLTPLLRQLCPPPYKLVAIMAHQPGSGKSLLNSILRDVHGGVFRAEMPHDEAELEKSLSSILHCTTAPVVQFDNVSGVLRSSRLAGLLTTDEFGGRILGKTEEVPMVNDRLWTITGNNLNLGGDLVRRTLWITLDPKVPDPHLRTGFRLNIPTFVKTNRGAILHALLVLIRHWVNAGQPMDIRSSDGYAAWSGSVRGILRAAGIPGTFDCTESAQQTIGTDDEGWGQLLAALHTTFGTGAFTTAQVIEQMSKRTPFRGQAGGQLTDQAQALVDSLPADLHDRYMRARESARAISRSLGMWLRNRDGRWAGDLVCEKAYQDPARNVPVWQVRQRSKS